MSTDDDEFDKEAVFERKSKPSPYSHMHWKRKLECLSQKFGKLLECPACYETMDATLKQCVNGHGVCSECAQKVLNCPTCRGKLLLKELRRNTLLGQILQDLPKPCPYNKKGCECTVTDSQHEMYCEYRPTDCKVPNCEWKGCVKELYEHVTSRHLFGLGTECLNVFQRASLSFASNESIKFFAPFVFRGQVFWKLFYRDCKTKCLYHQLYYLPTTKPTFKYYLHVLFDDGHMKYENYCKAEYFDSSNTSVRDMKVGMFIPDCELKRYSIPGSQHSYYYYLKFTVEDM